MVGCLAKHSIQVNLNPSVYCMWKEQWFSNFQKALHPKTLQQRGRKIMQPQDHVPVGKWGAIFKHYIDPARMGGYGEPWRVLASLEKSESSGHV